MDRVAESPGRNRRDLAADVCFVAIPAVLGVIAYLELVSDGVPAWRSVGSLLVALGSSAALWQRRRWPVGVALSVAVIAAVVPAATGAALLAVFSVAVHRPWRDAVTVGAVAALCAAASNALNPEGESIWLLVALVVIMYSALVGWGMYLRARRELVESLRQRARDAEAERDARDARARAQERARIAREMHDVLAHRISLVALNAGALEYRPDASEQDVAQAAAVVRENAHQALEELRGVIVLLRENPDHETGGTAPPQPTLRDLTALVADSRDAGMTVELVTGAEGLDGLPDVTGRTAYRVVQEGLTNVRKHAPGAAAVVTIAGGPERGLSVTVENGASSGQVGADPIPGSGTGLTGLAERVGLAGGSLDHGPRPEGFRLVASLPWERVVSDAVPAGTDEGAAR